MKNVLMKFAGLFVEKVPVDENGNPVRSSMPTPNVQSAPGAAPGQQPMVMPVAGAHPAQASGQPQQHPQQAAMPAAPQQTHGAPVAYPGQLPSADPTMPQVGNPQTGTPVIAASGAPVAVALRAWVPQEYAAHLAPFGVHVIAAGGSVTGEQALGWGAHVLVVSAECLGQDIHLLRQPMMPTVFITPQPMMIPDVAGVIQVQEPLRASDVAQAIRDAAASFVAPHA